MDGFRERFVQNVNFKKKGLFDAEADRLMFECSTLKYCKKDFEDNYSSDKFNVAGVKHFMAINKNKLIEEYFK